MKILYVTTISNTVNAFLIPHIKMLIELGHKVDVAFNIVQEVKNEINEMGCKIHEIPFQRSPFDKKNLLAYKKLKQIIESEQYELVHTHTPVASALVRIVCKKNKKTKVIYTAHGFHFFKGASIKNWILYYVTEKILARWTDIIITMNKEDYKNAIRLVSDKRCKVYYIKGVGIDLEKFNYRRDCIKKEIRRRYGYSDSDFIIIYVAELSIRKNQKQIIEAIKELEKMNVKCKLLIVGTGDLENKYKEFAKKMGLHNCIDFLGYRSDIPDLLSMSDIAVSSSKQEGLPVNVMEAMASGLPIVVTNARGNRDLVRNNVNGYVVDLNDSIAMASAINILYSSSDIRNKFRDNNLKLIKNYSIENILIELKSIYVNFF